MKGVVFTELLEMVEERYSLETVDQMISKAALGHGGIYTSVGTYPVEEMFALVAALAEVSKVPPPLLLRAFGEHLFGRFVKGYPALFEGVGGPLELLERVDAYIHVEVRKLYPEAELPRFEAVAKSERVLELTYRSPRRLGDFAHGLIEGCGRHFGVPLDIASEDLSDGRGEVVRFTITAT